MVVKNLNHVSATRTSYTLFCWKKWQALLRNGIFSLGFFHPDSSISNCGSFLYLFNEKCNIF